MQINLQDLEQAFASVGEIGQAETTFNLGDISVTLRVLYPSEEIESQKHASTALDGGASEPTAMEYLNKLRTAILSHAIVAIGEHDFRGLEYVMTGEVLPSGLPVKKPVYQVVRKLLTSWTRAPIATCFAKYHDLTLRAESEAENAIEYEPSDIDVEIDRLKGLIEELEEIREQRKEEVSENFKKMVGIVKEEQDQTAAVREVQPRYEPQDISQRVVEEPREGDREGDREERVMRRGPISPSSVAPPEVFTEPREKEEFLVQEDLPERGGEKDSPLSDVVSSMVDAEDPEALQQAMLEEQARLIAMRKNQATPQGELEGKPVYRQPIQDLEARPPAVPQMQQPKLQTGNKNPRFRGRK